MNSLSGRLQRVLSLQRICTGIFGCAISVVMVSILFLLACGGSTDPSGGTAGPSAGENTMISSETNACTGHNREMTERHAIDVFNWGYSIGLGIIQYDPTEVERFQQQYEQLTPACQQYYDEIGERLKGMLETQQIQDHIDKLPW